MKKINPSLLMALSLFFTIGSANADSDRGRIFKLAENVRSILWRSDPVPENFELTTEEADRAVAYSELEAEIGEFAYSANEKAMGSEASPCPPTQNLEEHEDKLALQEAIKRREFSIYYTGVFSDAEGLAQAEGVYGRNNYRSFMNAIASRGNSGAPPINSLNKLENKYLNSEGAVERDQWDSLSTVERSQLLQGYAESQVNQDVSIGLILSDYAIGSMLDNPNQWRESLKEIKDHLSFEEKVKIASHFGGAFGDDYNYDRANDVGDEGEGIVSIEEMLTAVRNSDTGGICRDVALAQSQILRELGVDHDDIYMIGYTTATGGHAVLAVEDPDNPGNIVKLNYSYITEENEVSGGAQLTQDTSLPDVGMQYRVYDADGKPVGRVPTEIGQIFNEVTNGQNNYDISKTYTLQKAEVQTPIGDGTVFTGTTSSGDNVVGVAINGRIDRGLTEIDYGVAVVKREGERTMVTMDQEALYGRLDYRLNTPDVRVGDNFRLNGFGGMRSEVMVMNTELEYKSNGAMKEGTNVDPMSTFYVGAEGEWESSDGRTRVNSEVVAESYVDWANEVNTSEGYTLALDNVRWTTGVEHGVTESMRVMGEGTIVMRQMGSSAILTAGIEDERRNYVIEGSYQTPLGDGLPSFMPGGSEAVSVAVAKSWQDEETGRGPNFRFYLERDLDFDNNRVGASVGWKF